jgi:hypothetical protein
VGKVYFEYLKVLFSKSGDSCFSPVFIVYNINNNCIILIIRVIKLKIKKYEWQRVTGSGAFAHFFFFSSLFGS